MNTVKPKKSKVKSNRKTPMFQGASWDFDKIEKAYQVIEDIAVGKYKLNVYTNQIEVISSEQMLDAYSSIAMPVMYNHWSFGKQFVREQQMYKRGYMGLAYEVVINSNPCISYLMEENTMCMQMLVIAHACFGHNSFFKNNYLFKQWTDADTIIDYLVFAKKYVSSCEELYGKDEVEKVLDSCHALMNYGVFRYKRPEPLSVTEEKERQLERIRYQQQIYNELWNTIPKKDSNEKEIEECFPSEPEENILYFIEKNAPHLDSWKRELIRIVRNISQYFHPQGQTKLMNEGYACVTGDTLIDTPNGFIKAEDIVNIKYDGLVTSNTSDEKVSQWYGPMQKKRIKIITSHGYTIHGGFDHKILINGQWVELNKLEIGDELEIVKGKDVWSNVYVSLPEVKTDFRIPIENLFNEYKINPRTYYKWKNKSGVVSDKKSAICEKIYDEFMSSKNKTTDQLYSKNRNEVSIPKYISEKFAYWLGLLLGDGNISIINKNKKIVLTVGNNDISLKDSFISLTKELFNVNVAVNNNAGKWKLIINNNTLVEFLLSEIGLEYGFSAHKKQVPKHILISPKSVVSAFIRGHMDSDGHADDYGNVILISKSKKLVEVEQQILLKMGIISTMKKQENDLCYRLLISGTDAKSFSEQIGFSLERKHNKLLSCIASKKYLINKTNTTKISKIVIDEGIVYDFGVDNTHSYKASCFINHNCFWHYTLMNDLYDEGIIDEGYMLEFLKSHTAVVAQPSFDSKHYSGINPYALGFAIYQDIKRICMNPTEEDKNWFPEFAGNGDWLKTIEWAMRNFKDESFVQQFLSPKVMRDFKFFAIVDDEDDTEIEVEAIHNDAGFKAVRKNLAAQYNVSEILPNIQVYNVNLRGDRSLTLRHYEANRKPLNPDSTIETLKHVLRLWEYPVILESVDINNQGTAKFYVDEKKTSAEFK